MREACASCVQNCLSVHGKTNSSSNVPFSFFKVMIGSDFSTVLYLPPKFGPTASALVRKKSIIEDSSGQQWEVIVSIVDESFAFKKGWNTFSTEHRLVVGDFLVFSYIGNSHFIVKIYDNSGCEKFDFPERRKQKKRSRSRTDLDARDDVSNGQCSDYSAVNVMEVEKTQSLPEDVVVDGAEHSKDNTTENNGNRKAQSLDKAGLGEDPCYMTVRDIRDEQREYRSAQFDVFSYEMLNTSSAGGSGKFTTRNAIVEANIYNKDPLLEEILDRKASQDPSEFELTGRSQFVEEIDERAYACGRHSSGDETPKHLLITYAVQPEETRGNDSTMSKRETQNYQFAEFSETDPAVVSKERQKLFGNFQNSQQLISEYLDAPTQYGELERMVKKEFPEMTPYACNYNDPFLSSRLPKVFMGGVAQSSQTTIKHHGSSLDSVKAETIPYGLPKVFTGGVAQSSRTTIKDHGSPLKSVKAEPIPYGLPKVFLGGVAQSSQTTIKHHGSSLDSVKTETIPYGLSNVFLGGVAQSSQTTIKDHGIPLKSVKAEPIPYGAAYMPTFISQMKINDREKDGAPSGYTEDTVADLLP